MRRRSLRSAQAAGVLVEFGSSLVFYREVAGPWTLRIGQALMHELLQIVAPRASI